MVGHQEEHLAGKNFEWWGGGMVISPERDANDLHMVQLSACVTSSSLASLKSRMVYLFDAYW